MYQSAYMINLEFKRQVIAFSELYVELGILEKLLRVAIPKSLGSSAEDVMDLKWLAKIKLDPENTFRVEKAISRRLLANKNLSVSITEFLPLSFWRWILHRRHFTTLWVPHTHKILVNPLVTSDLGTLKSFERKLYLANQDRNVIAHYNTSLIKGLDKSLENVRWLQEAMGLVKAE
jgi:hypothetical protein